VTDLLPELTMPMLVLHCNEDAVVPFSQGRLLVQSISGARFKAFEGCNHLILEDEPAWPKFKDEVRAFLQKIN
jgi:pimeloyl-ACP methyl ester carboxylesterase